MHGVVEDGGVGLAGAEEGEDCMRGSGSKPANDGKEGGCMGGEGEGQDGHMGVGGGLRHGWNGGCYNLGFGC